MIGVSSSRNFFLQNALPSKLILTLKEPRTNSRLEHSGSSYASLSASFFACVCVCRIAATYLRIVRHISVDAFKSEAQFRHPYDPAPFIPVDAPKGTRISKTPPPNYGFPSSIKGRPPREI